MKKILILFETSGGVSEPFRKAGFEVTTVDIQKHKIDNEHHVCFDLKKDISELHLDFSQFSLLIAFPPCTYFSKAGLHYLKTQEGRKEKQLNDLKMIERLWEIPIKRKCFENPAGSALNKLWKKASCKIDYRDYADFAKPTNLWLEGLPPLLPEQINLKKYGAFITKMGGSKKSRAERRSKTPFEVGEAMVKQWGYLLK